MTRTIQIAAAWMVIPLVAGCLTESGPASLLPIPAPAQGFVWEYPDEISIRHLGTATIRGPDHHAVPADVLLTSYPSQLIGYSDGPAFVEITYVEPGFGDILAVQFCEDTGSRGCGDGEHTLAYCPTGQGWLFGASLWYGQETPPPDWTTSIRGDVLVAEGDHPGLILLDGRAACSFFLSRGTIHFQKGSAAPLVLIERLGDRDVRIDGPAAVDVRPSDLRDWSSHFDAPSMFPKPTPSRNLFFPESDPSYHPFPFQAAVQQLQSYIQPEDILLEAYSPGTTPTRINSPAVGVTFVESWRWDMTILSQGEAIQYRVQKTQGMTASSPTYSVIREPTGRMVEGPPAMPQALVPIDDVFSLIDEAIDTQVPFSFSFSSGLLERDGWYPQYSFALADAPDQTTFHNVVVDAMTAEAISMMAPSVTIEEFLGVDTP